MNYQLEYAYTCHMGKVRGNNEDNFWCCGDTMEAENQGTQGVREGCVKLSDHPLLAVFDGMGGESSGEMAAYQAAQACGEYCHDHKSQLKKEPEKFLEEICRQMNQRVCEYGRENRILAMGSTVSLIVFGEEAGFGANLGDSRLYESRDLHFHQLSTDHVMKGGFVGKPPLTQYLGIHEEENMSLEPSIEKLEVIPGIRYLLCSDGMTDMLSDGEIADILTREITVRETVEVLLERALLKGGKDNVTIILCEITERERKNWLKQVLENSKILKKRDNHE